MKSKQSTSPSEPLDWKLFDRYRDYVKHEDTLINFRLTWMVAIQAVLFAAFGLVFQRVLEAKIKIAEKPELEKVLHPTVVDALGALAFLALFGIAISLTTRRTVLAAKHAQLNLERRALVLLGMSFDDTPLVAEPATKAIRWGGNLCNLLGVIGLRKQSPEITANNVARFSHSRLSASASLPMITGGGLKYAVQMGGTSVALPDMFFMSWLFLLAFIGHLLFLR